LLLFLLPGSLPSSTLGTGVSLPLDGKEIPSTGGDCSAAFVSSPPLMNIMVVPPFFLRQSSVRWAWFLGFDLSFPKKPRGFFLPFHLFFPAHSVSGLIGDRGPPVSAAFSFSAIVKKTPFFGLFPSPFSVSFSTGGRVLANHQKTMMISKSLYLFFYLFVPRVFSFREGTTP